MSETRTGVNGAAMLDGPTCTHDQSPHPCLVEQH